VDPVMRMRLRKSLFDLIDSHDAELARFVSEGALALDSYKEYIELFARSLQKRWVPKKALRICWRLAGL